MGYRGRDEDSGKLSAECRGYELRDREGEKVGKIDEVFVDEDDRPEYLGVKLGLLGGKLTLIPAGLAQADDERRLISVSESRERIKDAPSLGSNEEVTAERERVVRDYFGLDASPDSGSSSDEQRSREEDTSEIPTGHRQDPESRDTGSGDERPDETKETGDEDGFTGERQPWSDSDDSSTGSTESTGEMGAAAGSGSREREHSNHSKSAGEERQGRGSETGSEPGPGAGSPETMRVSVWREKARAEKILGEDGNEEVRVRKEWVEEEETIEVEDHRRG
ncbi:PRC-barrel domain-containing protein [Rubrobacter aplysinae]|uniref:PRC-barrel domain-containing protein n=1 Tax=Rubrobacter aplysinae TaxID=909625 RepID=UPI00064BE8DD|nr:PRC-barrel domain-containing protein [Rubrobacter aplysinae]